MLPITWRWRKQAPPKHLCLYKNLHGVLPWNNYLFISDAVKIPNLATFDTIHLKPSWYRKPLQVLISFTDPHPQNYPNLRQHLSWNVYKYGTHLSCTTFIKSMYICNKKRKIVLVQSIAPKSTPEVMVLCYNNTTCLYTTHEWCLY